MPELELPQLPHPLHEWVEIEVGSEGGGSGFWVNGLHSPNGKKMLRYESTLIAVYPTKDQAVAVGQEIALRASAERLLMALPYKCAFTIVND